MPTLVRLLPLCTAALLGVAAENPAEETFAEADTQVEADHRYVGQLGLSGLRFGGLIGGSAELSLRLFPDGPLEPEILGGVGISGTKIGVGARWVLGERRWVIGGGKGPVRLDTSTALTPRLVAYYRWEDEEREPDFWRGMVSADGWYQGFELGISHRGVCLDLAVTWHEDRDDPHVTLAYGISF